MIDILCYGGAAGAMTFALLMIIQTVCRDGWLVVPNVLSRIVERTVGRRRWKAGREAEELKRRIEWLENCSRQWQELRAQGREMMWDDTFGWIAGADVCPCGYPTECAIWCGDGHKGAWAFATDGTGWQYRKGQCDHDRIPDLDPEFIEIARAAIHEAHHMPGLTDGAGRPVKNAVHIWPGGDFVRPVMWDVKGAGGKYER